VEEQAQDPAQEAKRLERCINDLVGVLALPAIWRGSEPSQIIQTLLDVLLRMLGLEFAYARLDERFGVIPVEILRVAECGKVSLSTRELRNVLDDSFAADVQGSFPHIGNRSGVGDTSIFPVPLGIHGEIGRIVLGSNRAGFPAKTESLLLSVAANQASIGLREAKLLREQKRIAAELEQRVAERTQALDQTNAELRNEISERRRAEEALSGSEQSLRLILDGIAGLVAIMGATGEVEAVNRQVLDYFGKSLEEMKGWYTSDAIHPDDLPGVILAWRQSVETLSAYDVDHRLRRADNAYRWFHARGLPLLDAEGHIIRWYVLLTDIDDRRRAEEALRASEIRLRRVIDTIPTLAWCNLPDGPNESLNKPWHDYTGLSPEESHGWGWQVAFHPEDLPPLMKKWQELLTSGEPGEIEARLRRRDGVYRWFLIRVQPFRDEVGKIVRWYGTSTDIEDRKVAEEALARSEAFLAEGQHLSRTGSFSWSVNRGEITWSEELYRIFEFEQGTTVTPERIRSRIYPEDIQSLIGMIDQLREGVSDFEYEHRLLMPDNSVKYLHLTAHGRRDSSGRLEYIGAAQDVTQRRLSEEALGKARSELAKVANITGLGVLTASIAHEVNQPLSGIITNASTCLRMLSANPPNIDGAQETARRTIRDGNRASDVITRLRTLYSKKEPILESMDLNEAAREVTALSSTETQRNGVTLRQEFADDLPLALGDRIQLQQVILNLIRNAADAMSTIDDRPRELLIKTERHEGNQVRLSVKDSGIGLTPQAADKVFEAFYTTKTDGMGIGLSVSRSIIEAHRGRLWATGNDGPGSTFSFSIPCATG
jgi:PAS domain S-box-containing protein